MTTTPPPVPDLRLVVGYDGSPPAERALDAAVRLLQGRAGHLTVLHVEHVPSTAALSPDAVGEIEKDFAEVDQELRASAQEKLQHLAQGWDFEHRQGLVTDELMACATDAGTAHPGDTVVIVVGSSSTFAHRMVGSVAVGLARHSHVPLVIVP